MAEKKELSKDDFVYEGLWSKESKSGNVHLSGFNKELQRGFKLFKTEDGKYRLTTAVADGDLITLGEMRVVKFEDGAEIKVLGDLFKVSENQFYQKQKEEGKNAPEYTLRIRKGVLQGY